MNSGNQLLIILCTFCSRCGIIYGGPRQLMTASELQKRRKRSKGLQQRLKMLKGSIRNHQGDSGLITFNLDILKINGCCSKDFHGVTFINNKSICQILFWRKDDRNILKGAQRARLE